MVESVHAAELELPSVGLTGPTLLRLLRLSSAALPVGAFAYSHGLESAVAAGWVPHGKAALAWIEGVLRDSVAACDLPVLARIYRAFAAHDLAEAQRWNAWLFATRATSELQGEDRQIGTSLARLLAALGNPAAELWARQPTTTFCSVFALAAHGAGIGLDPAALGYASAFCEAQVGAAVRLVPLGQTEGQWVLTQLERAIVDATARALSLADDEVAGGAPGHAMASAFHETQYSRLFRS